MKDQDNTPAPKGNQPKQFFWPVPPIAVNPTITPHAEVKLLCCDAWIRYPDIQNPSSCANCGAVYTIDFKEVLS